MALHSSTLAWKIPWMEEPHGLQSMGSLGVGTTERLHFHFSLSCIGEGNGKPLQCSCLENPRDGGAWWAAVFGVAQSQTQLKRLAAAAAAAGAAVLHLDSKYTVFVLQSVSIDTSDYFLQIVFSRLFNFFLFVLKYKNYIPVWSGFC